MSVFGWIIIHQHLGYTFDWNLTWADYKVGFGSIDADFWLGLERIHLLTICQPHRLRVEVQQRRSNLWFSAEYWSFRIGDELNDKYRLEVDGYSGNAGDALMYEGDREGNGKFGWYLHNGKKFSTFDNNNDDRPNISARGNCAVTRGGGWWFVRCYRACLTCHKGDYEWEMLPGDNDNVVNWRPPCKNQISPNLSVLGNGQNGLEHTKQLCNMFVFWLFWATKQK